MKVFLKILLNIVIIILAFLLGRMSNNAFNNSNFGLINNKSNNIKETTNNSGTIIELDVIQNNKDTSNVKSTTDAKKPVKKDSTNLEENIDNNPNKGIRDIFFDENSDIIENNNEDVINSDANEKSIDNYIINNDIYNNITDETSQNLELIEELNNIENNIINDIDNNIKEDIDNDIQNDILNSIDNTNIENTNETINNNTENVIDNVLQHVDTTQTNADSIINNIENKNIDTKVESINTDENKVESSNDTIKLNTDNLDDVIANSINNI